MIRARLAVLPLPIARRAFAGTAGDGKVVSEIAAPRSARTVKGPFDTAVTL